MAEKEESEVAARVSDVLTEVRTVHSRAKAALVRLKYLDSSQWRTHPLYNGRDPLHDAIQKDLETVIAILDRYKRGPRSLNVSGKKE